MAKIKLDQSDRIRIYGDYKEDIFIDINGHKDQLGMSIEFYPSMQYVEIRKKEGVCKQFIFEKKGNKKYYDFGWWEDAEVVFSINEIKK